MARIVNGYPFDSGGFSKTEGRRLVRIRDLLSDDDPVFFVGPAPAGAEIRDGDVLVGMDGDFNVDWWSRGSALLNQRLCCLRTGAELYARYLFYVLPIPLHVINDLTYFTTVKHLSSFQVSAIRLPVPPLAEQRAIAHLLDRKTAAIEALIHKREQQLGSLDETWEAALTAAVTHGLDPTAPTKDSGLRWLGERIPTRWLMKRLKFISPRQSVGVVVNPSSYYADEGVPFLFGNNVKAGSLVLDGVRRISAESNRQLSASRLRAGDLVTVRVGAPGVTAVVPSDLDGCNCASMMIIRQHKSFDSKWLCYAMNSRLGRAQVEVVQYGAAQEQFNIKDAVNFAFPVPSLEEQHQLVAHLDDLAGHVNQTRAALNSQVQALREYRQALITAVVTGQLDVTKEAA